MRAAIIFGLAPTAMSIAAPIAAQTTSSTPPTLTAPKMPDDLQLLVGKRVIVGRLPLCVPKTYSVNMTYAGKSATVLSFTPNTALSNLGANMSRLPPNLRASFDDLKHGGILSFRFEDGATLDSCGNMALSALAPNLELAPGETIALPAAANDTIAPADPTKPQICPLEIADLSSGLSFGQALAEAITTSEFERQLDSAQNGGASKNYLNLRVRNDGQKPVTAFEFSSIYANRMGDETTSVTYISQNTQPIKPGAFYKASAMDRTARMQNGAGEVKVYISRVRFSDNSMWQDNGSRSCFRAVVSK